ncbi:flagellar filament outer layer protein FlaA [uncultured Treponema sp.]|uniref:flagellar filament outer layer protein FlaA n=1 Tax=uncultured Treponema sp. TaxID=162155 RepID=UPI0025F5A491|nr:flagellar filament outer layer protein FlaA [uncultured Treponema sp.]
MKKTLVLSAALMTLVGFSSFAEERTLIDFTTLKADIAIYPQDYDGEKKENQNKRTVMDYAHAAGASFSSEQKDLMKSSLALNEWEVVLNSSARNVRSLAQSLVRPAPVSSNSKQPFAGSEVMGVHVVFPTGAYNANAKIVPPFSIPAYEPYSQADDNGDRHPAEAGDGESSGPKWLFEADDPSDKASPAYGLVKNVGTLKKIAVTTMGMNFPHALYVLLSDTDNVTRRYFMGYLGFDGWKTLEWNNPEYVTEVRTREIRVYPVYPRGEPFAKFEGFQICRDAAHIGDDFVGYFKDVKIIYDKANLTSERDIADEDVWGVIGRKESARQALEMSRFGGKQVDRYIERLKMATEENFTPSLTNDRDSSTSAQGASSDAK